MNQRVYNPSSSVTPLFLLFIPPPFVFAGVSAAPAGGHELKSVPSWGAGVGAITLFLGLKQEAVVWQGREAAAADSLLRLQSHQQPAFYSGSDRKSFIRSSSLCNRHQKTVLIFPSDMDLTSDSYKRPVYS